MDHGPQAIHVIFALMYIRKLSALNHPLTTRQNVHKQEHKQQ